MVVNNYGKMAAQRRSRENAKRKKELDKPKPLTSEEHKKSLPDPEKELFPLEDEKLMKKVNKVKFKIDWDRESTEEHSSIVSSDLKHRDFKLLVMPPGTGKTAVAIKTIGKRQLDLNQQIPVIITSTSKVIQGYGWLRHIVSWNETYPDNPINPVLVTTVDKFKSYSAHGKVRAKIVKHLKPESLIILDEVHKYKNPTGKRAKTLQNYSMFKRIGLSATPITQDRIMDVSSYLIMNNNYRNKTDFMTKTHLKYFIGFRGELMIYDEKGRVNRDIWPEYDHVLENYSKVLYKPDTSYIEDDMPEIKKYVIQLPFSEQLQSDMKSLLKAKRKRMFDSPTDYRMEGIRRINVDEQRLDKLIEIINQDFVKQPLIFYENIVVKEALIERLNQENIQFQSVGSDSKFEDFNHDLDTPVLIQYQSGSEGIELKNSNTSVFYQNQYSYAVYDQARGRNRRLGMDKNQNIHHYHLVADDPFDERIYQIVPEKEELSKELLDEAFEKSMKNYE